MIDNHETHLALLGLLAGFLAQLNSADALRTHESPLLTEWETSDVTGDPDNEVLRLNWEDQTGRYAVYLTEDSIAPGQWRGNTFHCLDSEGDELRITLFRLIPVSGSPAS
ncbi:hypothetical protein BLA9940_04421 [Burkholderia aenigmatica]|uniref:hypothetical protein n=1 Tax=Burkholderia aenigmatica TaxID=2015348 RepID=UPI001452D3D3|nr:hypothetical protein [Burkholderia aenigmatica]VWC75523.1 hypothetical protein BLA9940_04421 [Burkholderia aenigmatica]